MSIHREEEVRGCYLKQAPHHLDLADKGGINSAIKLRLNHGINAATGDRGIVLSTDCGNIPRELNSRETTLDNFRLRGSDRMGGGGINNVHICPQALKVNENSVCPWTNYIFIFFQYPYTTA